MSVAAWIPPISNAGSYHQKSSTTLSVLSQDIRESIESETEEASKVPYVISRGDGSTGGGGLPMPQKYVEEDDEETEELRRPKVNAEMPQG